MKIDKDILKEWSACQDGYRWFLEKFPQGADLGEVQKALNAEKRFDDAYWLADKLFNTLMITPANTATYTAYTKSMAADLIEQTKLQVEVVKVEGGSDALNDAGKKECQIGSSGGSAKIGSSGGHAQIGSSGGYAQIGSSGGYAQIGSSGDSAQIGSSGDYAQIGSSGGYAKIGSSGDSARVNATGKNAAVACGGPNSKAKAAEGGFIALTWFDQTAQRPRITVGYVGENIKADIWYEVSAFGELQEVTE